MKRMDEWQDPNLEQHFSALRETPPRDPAAAARGRERFLAEARNLAPAVSPAPKVRHTGWMYTIRNLFSRKESRKMSAIANFIVAIVMLVGGTGVTAAAAQGSLPDSFLYPVKLWTEDIRLSLTGDAGAQIQMNMEFANRRTEEIQRMLEAGNVPPEQVNERLQLHLNNALQLAAQLDGEQMNQALFQMQQELQVQVQRMINLQANANADAAQLLTRTREMLQERLRLTDAGLEDPEQLRQQLKTQDREQLRTSQPEDAGGNGEPNPEPGDGQDGEGYGPGEGGYGPGPDAEGTPEPGGAYGPGPGEPSGECTCTPQQGTGGGNGSGGKP